MFILTLLRIISVLMAIVGATYLIPLSVAIVLNESEMIFPFLIPMILSILFAFFVNVPLRHHKFHMNIKQTFIVVAVAWISASFFGAIPFYFSGYFNSFTDCIFESVSGFTTTGATILSEIESLPRSLNLWRCQTHWLGGMGIVTLTVALLPLLGVGGFQLIKAETTGPEKGKVTARITTTAKLLWIIYSALTFIEMILLMIFGMDFVDALSHAFSTLGTGGFSTKNSSVAAYNSVAIDTIITIFMFLAGINFSLFYYLIIRNINDVFSNSELRAYFFIVVISILATTFFSMPFYKDFGTALRYSAFQVVSIITTTGFATADYLLWPSTAQFFIFLLFFIGGCSGSTGGGVKVIRWVVLFKQVGNETKKTLHPHGVFKVRLDGKVGRHDIVYNVAAFITLYLTLILITTFVGCLNNLDITTSFTASLSMVGNVGPAFGTLGPTENYSAIAPALKWFYSFAMLAGRLELYTILIYFMPSFWKK